MKKLLPIILLLFSVLGNAQKLLENGGFEEENTCTEFHVECAPEAWLTNDDGFSNYFKDKGRAHDGLRFMAIEAGHSKKLFKRTFIRSPLICGLRPGSEYVVEFYIKSPHPILDSIGIYFTPYDFLFDSRPLQEIEPTEYISHSNKFSTADTNWQKVKISYVASGNESFFTIANFSKRDITGSTGIHLENHFFVFIDDVSIVARDSREKLCNDWQRRKKEIYEQDERHLFLRKKIKEGKMKTLQPVVLPVANMTSIDTLILPDMLFASGKADLQSAMIEILDHFCKTINGRMIDSIAVEGHTDNTGTVELNEKLSFERANAVGNYFMQKAIIKPARLTVRGWGSQKPILENDSEANKQRNRRVEVFVYIK